jgi:photosystem II stability/assembly factor-like uncharacterized protein
VRTQIKKSLWLLLVIFTATNVVGLENVITIPALDSNIDRITFFDDTTGWACASFPGILKTNDGGNTWTKLNSNLSSERIYAVWFTAINQGWAVGKSAPENGANPVILSTNDGGSSWAIQKRLPEIWELLDVFFINGLRGWVVGHNDSNEAIILSTMDGGIHWKSQLGGFRPATLTRIRFADLKNGWAVGNNLVLHTRNGGIIWKSQGFRDKPFLNGLSVLDKDNAWIVGGQNALYRTVNGGANWDKVIVHSDPSLAYLHSVGFADRNNGWACGKDGIIFSTKDQGLTWSKESSPISSFLWDIAVTKTKLFFGAEEGRILIRQR